jgi:hypothetical protein
MIQFTKEIPEGFIVTVEHLNRLFAIVNEGDYQWAISDKRVPVGGRDYVEIGFSNPPVPNTISFLFPVVNDPGKPESVEVCLHPEAASIGQTAMYFVDSDLKQDGLRDWLVFWTKLSFMLETKPGVLFQVQGRINRKPVEIELVDLVTGKTMDRVMTDILDRKTTMLEHLIDNEPL